MTPQRTHQISATLLWSLVGLGLLWLVIGHVVSGLRYTVISERTSPNGKLRIFEFQSNSDGRGHAPYGRILALSQGAALRDPDEGHVFFAGDCSPALRYTWKGNDEVFVHCPGGGQGSNTHTLGSVMHGVKVVHSVNLP